MIKKIENNEQFAKDEFVLVDYFATWCGPCKMLMPTIDEIGKDASFDVLKVDIDKNPALAKEAGVKSIPTIILYKNGQELDRFTGYKTKASILELVNKHNV